MPSKAPVTPLEVVDAVPKLRRLWRAQFEPHVRPPHSRQLLGVYSARPTRSYWTPAGPTGCRPPADPKGSKHGRGNATGAPTSITWSTCAETCGVTAVACHRRRQGQREDLARVTFYLNCTLPTTEKYMSVIYLIVYSYILIPSVLYRVLLYNLQTDHLVVRSPPV